MDQYVIVIFKKYYICRPYKQALKVVEDNFNMNLSDFWKSFDSTYVLNTLILHGVRFPTPIYIVFEGLCAHSLSVMLKDLIIKKTKKILENLFETLKMLGIILKVEDFKNCLSHIRRN